MTKVPPALPQLRGELGLSLLESGLIVTTFNVLGMLVGVLAGVLCDRFGRKRLAEAISAGLGRDSARPGVGWRRRGVGARAQRGNRGRAQLYACSAARWPGVMG